MKVASIKIVIVANMVAFSVGSIPVPVPAPAPFPVPKIISPEAAIALNTDVLQILSNANTVGSGGILGDSGTTAKGLFNTGPDSTKAADDAIKNIIASAGGLLPPFP
jgi:hypothetical protein